MSGMELWWLGQSGFQMRDPDGGPVLYVDPYLSPHKDRTWEPPIGPDALAQADLVLCTHEHIDHFDQPALKAANEAPGARFKLVVPEPIVGMAVALGIPADRVIGAQPHESLEFPGVKIHPVPARHGVNVSDAYSFGEQLSHGLVRYLGYVVELGGVRAYHAGDTVAYEGQADLLRSLSPDLALLPINGSGFYRERELNIVGNLNPREAAHLALDMGAHVIVPMHWDIFSFNRGYPRDLVAYVDENMPQLTVFVFGRAARFVYRPDKS